VTGSLLPSTCVPPPFNFSSLPVRSFPSLSLSPLLALSVLYSPSSRFADLHRDLNSLHFQFIPAAARAAAICVAPLVFLLKSQLRTNMASERGACGEPDLGHEEVELMDVGYLDDVTRQHVSPHIQRETAELILLDCGIYQWRWEGRD